MTTASESVGSANSTTLNRIEELKDKKYEDLLVERDKLIKRIKKFENRKQNSKANFVISSSSEPEVIYQVNLLYLGKLCDLIAEKYNKEIVWGDMDIFD